MMRNHNHDYFTILKQLKKLKSKLREWYVVIHCLGGGGEREEDLVRIKLKFTLSPLRLRSNENWPGLPICSVSDD